MMDQCDKFMPLGLATNFVGEAQNDSVATQRVIEGKTQLVYISPESILKHCRYRHMLLSLASILFCIVKQQKVVKHFHCPITFTLTEQILSEVLECLVLESLFDCLISSRNQY